MFHISCMITCTLRGRISTPWMSLGLKISCCFCCNPQDGDYGQTLGIIAIRNGEILKGTSSVHLRRWTIFVRICGITKDPTSLEKMAGEVSTVVSHGHSAVTSDLCYWPCFFLFFFFFFFLALLAAEWRAGHLTT